MPGHSEIRDRISRDLATMGQHSNPKSITEIADDYLLGDPSLSREVVEHIIKQEADRRKIPIH